MKSLGTIFFGVISLLLSAFYGLTTAVDNKATLIKCIIFNLLSLALLLYSLKSSSRVLKFFIFFLVLISLLIGGQAVKRLYYEIYLHG